VSPAELLDDPYSPNELPAETPFRPFGAIAGKWRPAALSAFLRDPLESYPDGRMPSLNLSEEEADAIANYLSAHFGPARDLEGAATEEELALGRKLFVARDCGGCHGLESAGLTLLPAAVPFAGLDASKACLSESVEGAKSPRYDLDAATRAALVGFIANELPKTSADEGLPSHELARAFERHACRACHIVDSAGGPPDDAKVYFWTAEEETDLGDEGRFPPNLSGVGHKLTTSWMREVLTNAGTARPYMATRMPQFGSDHLDGLAELFAAQEGLRPDSDVAPPVMNDELVMTGRELMGLDKMACVTCHVYKDFPPLSTDGPDMTAFAERLRYEWWRGYIHDPQRYKPGTRMPTFGTGNVSSFKDVLDGDLTRQADALWAYMNLGDFMPVPEGLEADSEMIIAVGDRPVVMRAFLPEVGARGIAVGNPNGLHYAYDAERARLVHAWTGEFLDAAGSWAGRGGSENDELGDVVWRALPGPAIWLNTDFSQQATPEFRGYALDRDGSPVFYSDLDGVRIEEQIITSMQPERTIRRHFRLTGLSGREMVFVRVATDATRMVEVAGGNAMQWGELVDAQTFEPVEDLPGMTWAIELDADTDQLAFVMVEDVQ
ncbi:MAG: hypothetical protein KDC14_10740, partial [Planctomycetes bacterium]|nr:hypothetical protein [Planctomycetota bacterium]